MEKPSYYSIIPADVRYDNRLKPNEKLMYGEITSLASKHGICFASNDYFADLYNKTNQTITVWISHLKNLGYIHVKTFRKGMLVTKRCISIRPIDNAKGIKKNLNTVLRKKRIRSYEKSKQGIKKNLKDNNTSVNNTSMNNREKRQQAQVDSLLNSFQQLWAEDPGLKFRRYMNKWIAHEPPAKIISVMKYARKNCRTSNPNAIGSYMNGCFYYPMKPKKSNYSSKPKYHSRGDHDDSKYNHKARF